LYLGVTVAGAAACALLGLAGLAGARFNMTASLPKGLYWALHDPIARGTYVRFCPPATGAFAEAMNRGYLQHGRCPTGYAPMIKRVSGVAGDTIDIYPQGIRVNGTSLPLSAARKADSAGRPLPHPEQTHLTLTATQLWVMSDTNERSFDSRYFGPIDRAWVKDVVRPVLTWGYGGTFGKSFRSIGHEWQAGLMRELPGNRRAFVLILFDSTLAPHNLRVVPDTLCQE
jgi:conjugative transfer signal peptidase TraF